MSKDLRREVNKALLTRVSRDVTDKVDVACREVAYYDMASWVESATEVAIHTPIRETIQSTEVTQ